MFNYLRITCASYRLLNLVISYLNIETDLNPGKFLICLSEISIILIVIKVIKQSNPLSKSALAQAKEYIGYEADAAHLDSLAAAHSLHDNDQLVRGFRVERDSDLALSLASLVGNHENILQFPPKAHVVAKLADFDRTLEHILVNLDVHDLHSD